MRPETVNARWRRFAALLFCLVTLLTSCTILFSAKVVNTSVADLVQDKTQHLFTQFTYYTFQFHEKTKSKPSDDSSRLVVSAHYRENLRWTTNVDVSVKLIEKDNPANPDNLYSNNATEATSYLYYMIKYYYNLPDVIAFVHGHGDTRLRDEAVWTVQEYTALPKPDTVATCNTRHKTERGWLMWFGTPDLKPKPPDDMNVVQVTTQYQRAFHDLFDFLRLNVEDGGMGMEVPHYVTTLCCSQFSVDRETIRRVPRERLMRLFEYLENSGNRDMGVAMEYVWTMLFNQRSWD